MYCCVEPEAKLALAGVTAMEVRVFAAVVTVRTVEPETPLRAAAMVVDPAETPVARPLAATVATAGAEEVHAAVEVTLAVVPLL